MNNNELSNNLKEQNTNNKNLKSSFASFFISKPVFTWVMYISVAIVGMFLLQNTNLRENPKVETPSISIEMEYPGASTQVVESQIANLMEEELAGIEGLKSMKTVVSKSGQTKIDMHFSGNRNTDSIATEVETKMRRIKNSFPQGLKDPSIRKSGGDDRNLMTLAISGGKYSASELSDIGYRYAKSEFESINGIASVKISGISGEGRTFRIDVWLDPDKLYAFKLTPMDVYNAIAKQSYLHPAGHIEINNIRYNATIANDLKSAEEFADVVLKEKSGKVIKVQDVARVEMQKTDEEVRTRHNGQVASFINIGAQPQANQIEVAAQIKKKLVGINKGLPHGIKIEPIMDQSEPVKQSLNRVVQTIFEAIIFVVIVMLLFLKSWKSSIIPLIAIPICLLSGVITIAAFGYSINVITLLAMVLAVGLVVDDAIVAIEVIHRRMQKGENAKTASIHGMAEIQFSIIAMTLTLVAVYAPISLSTGLVGKMFTEFSVSLSVMVLVSGIVALTLTPVMTASLLQNDKQLDWKIIKKFDKLLVKLENTYKKYLTHTINYRNYVMLGAFIFGLLGFITAKYGIKSIIVPEQDKGVIAISLTPTSGANVKYMEYTISKAETIIKKQSGVDSVYSDFHSGGDRATLYALLAPFANRKSSKIIAKNIEYDFKKSLPGTQAHISSDIGSLGGNSQEITAIIKSNKSYDELERLGLRSIRTFQSHPAIENIRYSRVVPEKTFNMEANRGRALSLGVDLSALRDNVAMIMRGNPPAVRYERDGKRYPVSVWADEKFRKDPEGIKRFHVYTNIPDEKDRSARKLISLKDIIQVVESSSRPMILHQDGVRAFEIYGSLKPGYDTITTYKDIESQLYASLPSGYVVSPGLNVKNLMEEGSNFSVILILALIFIFLILAAQFESFYDPLIIMTSVPLALSGAILTIFFIPGLSLNIYSQIGLVTLIGLITKHAVLIVDYYKKELEAKNDIIKSVMNASLLRLKPILMTTLAMVLGAAPLILAGGFGSEFRREIGWVIVGGMSFGTFFTLFVIPAACIVFADLRFLITKVKMKDDNGRQ
ncbi:efflux RND transporter permease subunit [Candidatus Cytomitobacter primus]|uniref:Efflux RND transporter permease subunit n=1 Tax=Candidatus Cytomitobacter primus TaxID=2066024 RepID=A0A5C0UGF6_9PROT|nr:efflux RND transporter permease subunit [Candidatus Cytomitobacter primus]QEK38751.1 efflux RND transporter permease subunit [Candidatus Cytomitobacter primus]